MLRTILILSILGVLGCDFHEMDCRDSKPATYNVYFELAETKAGFCDLEFQPKTINNFSAGQSLVFPGCKLLDDTPTHTTTIEQCDVYTEGTYLCSSDELIYISQNWESSDSAGSVIYGTFEFDFWLGHCIYNTKAIRKSQ